MTPPFLTWSFKSASAAVVPGAPGCSRPISFKISATESPTAGVGASERSTMPNGTLSLLDASRATSWPTRVILNAVFLIVSQRISKSESLHSSSACLTTPGPETPTLMTKSPSVTPWKAPAIKGLSSGALQKTTSLAQPRESLSFVCSAACLMIVPMSRTASMLMPVLVEPRQMELQTRSVTARASGIDSMSSRSAFVMCLETSAE